MFGRSLLIFVFLLICLGVGTIWIVEKETDATIVSHDYQFITSEKFRSFDLTNKIRFQYWWSQVSGSNDEHMTSIRYENTDSKQPELVKWQDEKGTWHFEYKKPLPPADKQQN